LADDFASPILTLKSGTFLAAIGKQFGGADLNFDRDRTPPDPPIFD
jgi:hypothetical protein